MHHRRIVVINHCCLIHITLQTTNPVHIGRRHVSRPSQRPLITAHTNYASAITCLILINTSTAANTHNASADAPPQQPQELERLLDDILHQLKVLVMKKEMAEAEVALVDEWRMVAQVMDRFLFWLFLFVTLCATVVLMVVVPMLEYMRTQREE